MSQTSDSNAIYLTQIHQLKNLQKVDDEIHEIEKSLEKGPKELEKVEARFAQVQEIRNKIQDKLDHMQKQKQQLTRESEEEYERQKKSKDKLMATGNEREYNAVTREIDNIEKSAQGRERELTAIQEELNTQNAMLDETQKEYVDLQVEVESLRSKIEKNQAEADRSLKKLRKRRTECTQDISRPILLRYEFIRERLEHPVIVALKDPICPSCHISVPPQTYNDLLRGGQIMSCPNCQRLIVSYEAYIEDDEEAKQQAAIEKELERQKEQASAKTSHRKTSSGRSAALDKDYNKEDRDEVEFGHTSDDEMDDDMRMVNHIIETDLDNLSRSAGISDLTDMPETTGLTDLGGDSESSDKDDMRPVNHID
ncbi:MAG: C4-type zinc ribbon domain-containing protein [Desulfovibrionaceae bacterium]|nr:C4-type zinc ribbon domain-containing protein [Desulfovibrionaceae bacterium]